MWGAHTASTDWWTPTEISEEFSQIQSLLVSFKLAAAYRPWGIAAAAASAAAAADATAEVSR